MLEKVEYLYRLFYPGIVLAALLAPVLVYAVGFNGLDLPVLAASAAVMPFIGAAYHLGLKLLLEKAVDRCWTEDVDASWESELKSWKVKSWFFPGAKLGYRVRRVRFLLSTPDNDSLLKLISAPEARGIIDTSSYKANPDLKHKVRVSYVYAEVGTVIAGLISLVANAVLVVYLLLKASSELRFLTASLLVIVLDAVLVHIFRKAAGYEIARAESVQHSLAILDGDQDVKVALAVLENLREDLSVAGGSAHNIGLKRTDDAAA
jgi:hypothetical protein